LVSFFPVNPSFSSLFSQSCLDFFPRVSSLVFHPISAYFICAPGFSFVLMTPPLFSFACVYLLSHSLPLSSSQPDLVLRSCLVYPYPLFYHSTTIVIDFSPALCMFAFAWHYFPVPLSLLSLIVVSFFLDCLCLPFVVFYMFCFYPFIQLFSFLSPRRTQISVPYSPTISSSGLFPYHFSALFTEETLPPYKHFFLFDLVSTYVSYILNFDGCRPFFLNST